MKKLQDWIPDLWEFAMDRGIAGLAFLMVLIFLVATFVASVITVVGGFAERTVSTPTLATGVTALATIGLVLVTVLLVFTNATLIRQNRQLSEQNRITLEQERERDFQRRRLDEMQHWTEEVGSLSLGGISFEPGRMISVPSDVERAARQAAEQAWTDQLNKLLGKEGYILYEAQRLDTDVKDLDLQHTSAENLVKDISTALEGWTYWYASGDIGSRFAMRESCLNLLKLVSDLRAELKL